MRIRVRNLGILIVIVVGLVAPDASAGPAHAAAAANSYKVVKLVADQAGKAKKTDTDLVNPWGMADSATSPWWVADHGTNRATIYGSDGTKATLVVSMQGPPTAAVFNPNAGEFRGNQFLFSTSDGLIEGWTASDGVSAAEFVNNSASQAEYMGLALDTSADGDFLYAADFHNGVIQVFDSNLNERSLGAGAFVDPALPSGYEPYSLQDPGGGILYVTYVPKDASGQPLPGAGHGIVDAFDAAGVLLNRVATGGALNLPWGIAVAPSIWGAFHGDLLISNNGNGRINAYTVVGAAWKHVGVLKLATGKVLTIAGLRGLGFGNGGSAGAITRLYFTAGPAGGAHGLFGYVSTS